MHIQFGIVITSFVEAIVLQSLNIIYTCFWSHFVQFMAKCNEIVMVDNKRLKRYDTNYCLVKSSDRYWIEAGNIEQLRQYEYLWHPYFLPGHEKPDSTYEWPNYLSSSFVLTFHIGTSVLLATNYIKSTLGRLWLPPVIFGWIWTCGIMVHMEHDLTDHNYLTTVPQSCGFSWPCFIFVENITAPIYIILAFLLANTS